MKPEKLADSILSAKAAPAGLPAGSQPVASMFGVVSSIQTGPPPSLTITLGGSTTTIAGIRYLTSYNPVVNDTVVVLQSGSDLIVVSSLAGATVPYPLGTVGQSSATSNKATGGGGTETSALLTVTFTAPAGRAYRSTFFAYDLTGTANGDQYEVNIKESTTRLGASSSGILVTGAQFGYMTVMARTAPSAGSHTYNVTMQRISGTGTGTLVASSTAPMIFIVEDIGSA